MYLLPFQFFILPLKRGKVLVRDVTFSLIGGGSKEGYVGGVFFFVIFCSLVSGIIGSFWSLLAIRCRNDRGAVSHYWLFFSSKKFLRFVCYWYFFSFCLGFFMGGLSWWLGCFYFVGFSSFVLVVVFAVV